MCASSPATRWAACTRDSGVQNTPTTWTCWRRWHRRRPRWRAATMMRRRLIETVRSDPEYNNGNYTAKPRIMKIAKLFHGTGTNGGNSPGQKAGLLAINAADNERNPPETGLLDRELKRVKNGRLLLIPASDATTGHGTTASAEFYAKELSELLRPTPARDAGTAVSYSVRCPSDPAANRRACPPVPWFSWRWTSF